MTYSIELLRAAHRSATVHVTVRQGTDTYSGVIVGIGSKLAIQAGTELIEDVPVERVVWATVPQAANLTGPGSDYDDHGNWRSGPPVRD